MLIGAACAGASAAVCLPKRHRFGEHQNHDENAPHPGYYRRRRLSNGGSDLNTPLKVIEQVGKCRIVVTGAYHAAVFALAQGIPVVGFAKSTYVREKFLGLADQFGTGCETVDLDAPDFAVQLETAMTNAWLSATTVRAQLLKAAERQIESSYAAYQRVGALLPAVA